jgi:AcrR family transcriptional regulator
MSRPSRPRRRYASKQRSQAAAATQARILAAAKSLFMRRGIDAVTLDELAKRARVSTSTVYGLFRSKEGVLRKLMEGTLFGPRYRAAASRLNAVTDPVAAIDNTAAVARAIHESDAAELGLLRGASAFSPALRKIEQAFEEMRFALQEERIVRLYAAGKAKEGLPLASARRLLWMYTSREIYRLLVQEGGWTPEAYEAWLAQTLLQALVARSP